MPFNRTVKDKLREENRFDCCEFCGAKAPRLENNGLQAAHIISESDSGIDDITNAMVLCHQCAEVFDRFIKPTVAKAFELINKKKGTNYSAPPNWRNAEGRRASGDNT